ncbi:MAG: protein kinase [Proteobacteria bacterium]|nr:protein kinase [Pseudomonadota bacterium]
MPLHLGPFRLHNPIASGGMGTVWLAEHREQGVAVAIKILGSQVANDPQYLSSFRDEVRAVAKLDHPSIVMVLDYGEVTTEAAAASDELVAGTPWLAMELASGGTLKSLAGRLRWTELKPVLLAILDALAHAHARGVIHRDLKPGNVLISTRKDQRPGLKLTDFGIAHALGDSDKSGEQEAWVAGTPMYMSPEQIMGEWRDYGPWTDLYSLGCMTYLLCTGEGPYEKRPGHALMMAQMHSEPRPFVPKHRLPEGFGSWLSRLMAKDRNARFQCAADAARELLALDADITGDFAPFSGLDHDVSDTLRNTLDDRTCFGESWRLALLESPTPPPISDTWSTEFAPPAEARSPSKGARLIRPRGPRVPPVWRRPMPAAPPPKLIGAGRSLYGLRAVPLVGRHEERDQIWEALQRVEQGRRAEAIVIRGPAGAGKSRLVEWACQRAHETGAARFATARFSPNIDGGESIRRMGVEQLRSARLPRESVEKRVRAFLSAHGNDDEEEVQVLTEILQPATKGDLERGARPRRLTRPSHFYSVTRSTTAWMATQRPMILWLDDVHWGAHGLSLARHILRTQAESPFPVLILLTLRDEGLAGRAEETDGLARLQSMSPVRQIALKPLDSAERRDLVRGLLGLDDALAAQVEERTAGNPLFAVNLVGDWVRRGILEPGPHGYRLQAGASAALPSSLSEVWANRIDRVLAEFKDEARAYLEVASILGPEVHRDEWRQACDDPQGFFGARFPGDSALRSALVERLFAESLATGTVEHWSFAHSMLREALWQSSRQGQRWQAQNLACAMMLWARAPSKQLSPAERLGTHLLEAGQIDQAVEPLLGAVEIRLMSSGPKPALALVDKIETALAGAGVPGNDKRWGPVLVYRSRIHRELGEFARALEFAQEAGSRAKTHGWRGSERYALHQQGLLNLDLGQVETARVHFETLKQLALASAAPRHVGLATAGLAEVDRRLGRADAAAKGLRQAVELLEAAGDPQEAARVWRRMGAHEEARGAMAFAAGLYEQALAYNDRLGLSQGVAMCRFALGRIGARIGEPEGAVLHLTDAVSRLESLGDPAAGEARAMLVWCLVAHGDLAAACQVARQLRGALAGLEHDARIGATLTIQLLHASHAKSWERFDLIAQERGLLRPQGDLVVAWLLSAAALAAATQDPTTERRPVAAAAKRAWLLLGEPEPEA